MLQWGHRFSSVEILALLRELYESTKLQWGHRFSSVEISSGVPGGVGARQASMGPPIFIGGNAATLRSSGCATSGFNGATDFHRWKSSSMRRTRRENPPCFNGATDFHRWKCNYVRRCSHISPKLQWGHRFSSVEMAAARPRRRGNPWRFNGATDFHRWK